MHGVLLVDAARSAEVNQLDDRVILVLEVDILRFDVTMHDVVLVQVVHGGEQLSDHVGGLHLIESVIGGDTLVESASVHHLIDEEDLLLVFVHFAHLADVGVV